MVVNSLLQLGLSNLFLSEVIDLCFSACWFVFIVAFYDFVCYFN